MESSKTLKEILDLIMVQAKEKGFGTTPDEIAVPEKIALIHSEISEAFEAYRHKDINGAHGLTMELGDAITRILHLCGALNLDIEGALLSKIDSNKTRVWKWEEMNEGHQ